MPMQQDRSLAPLPILQGSRPGGQFYRPEDWPLARALATNEVINDEEIEVVNASGEQKVLSVSAAPVRDAAADGDAGRMLASFALVRLGGSSQVASDPAKLALLKQKEQLEQKVDLLKYQRAAMSPEEYRSLLSQTLVALAKVQQELDK